MAVKTINVAELTGKELDYWMYRHAAQVLGSEPTREDFETKYSEGQFTFSKDKALLYDLIMTYDLRLQQLAGEWLASTTDFSQYGPCPITASCRWLIGHSFGVHIEDL